MRITRHYYTLSASVVLIISQSRPKHSLKFKFVRYVQMWYNNKNIETYAITLQLFTIILY